MKRLCFNCSVITAIFFIGLFCRCSQPSTPVFTEKMLEGDWIPVDTTRYHKLPGMFYMAINLYNNKGGFPDTLYKVKNDSLFVRTYSDQQHLHARHKDKWKFWHRILAVRNDSLFLYKRRPDSLAIFLNANVHSNKKLRLKTLSYAPQDLNNAKNDEECRIELQNDSVFVGFAQKGNNEIRTLTVRYALSGSRLFDYFVDLVQKVDWHRMDSYVPDPSTPGPYLNLSMSTNEGPKNYCCIQGYRDPVFNLLIHELNTLPTILTLEPLKTPHRFFQDQKP
jgi:hypothetical protein